ncbi:phosphatidate cytidylyltransferase 2 [Brachionus plicatilis]|uniref:Phosphatidate cytidylyltransferase n=1 Tax=Brachionus plicatilis TaxID=10195 RepID=A0A3M7RRG0_BRAPC|nr:phosphatidate cytidylyltransferase 2 [Brachionus plicatilis]
MRNTKKLPSKSSDNECDTKSKAHQDNSVNFYSLSLDPRWKGPILRSTIGLLLIATFSLIIKIGPVGLVFLVMLIFLRGFQELLNVGFNAFSFHTVPYSKTLSYTLLFIFNYFILGSIITEKFGHLLTNHVSTLILVQHHKFISFNLYTLFFIIFVLMLQKPHYHKQYTLFGYIHILMLLYVSCYMSIGNILHGSIWFIVPVLLVIFNDIAAYVFGHFYGRIKLIDISPNKTWEGFIGAFFTTLIFGQIISPLMCPYEFFTCPIELGLSQSGYRCHDWQLFQKEKVAIFGIGFGVFPFQKHAFFFSLYASLVAPFGGFFASGFKRAIGIKDFGNTIPGHGGIIDRFDCHILTNIFIYLYIHSVIN